jgi:hypothetical protein
MPVPYKASQHSYGVFFVARGFQMQAVRCTQDGTCKRLQLGAEFGPLPQPDQASTDEIILHTCSMAVSQHDPKARALKALNSDSFSRSQRPPQKQELHGLSPSSPHSHRWRVPGLSRNRPSSVKKAHFVAGEYGGATLRIYGVAVGPRGRTYRV